MTRKLLFLFVLLFGGLGMASSALGQKAVAKVTQAESLKDIEDPQLLLEEGKRLFKAGDKELAKKSFEASIARDEVNHYVNFAGSPYGDAVLLELMGDLKASRAIWRTRIQEDVVTTWRMIKTHSVDPKKNVLLTEAKKRLEDAITAVKAGETPHIYTTKKGKKRNLKAITQDEALAAFEAGEKLRYVYLEDLDLTGKTFTKPIQCSRCVFGTIRGYGSNFAEAVKLARVTVMGDVHFGKKWQGEVNKSSFDAPAHIERLYLDSALIFGNLNMDSVVVQGRVANLPLMSVEGNLDFRNTQIKGVAEFRFARIEGSFNAKGAQFEGSNYFGHVHMGSADFSRVVVKGAPLYFNGASFAGDVVFSRGELVRGATFEGATFGGTAVFQQCRVYDRLNMSRVHFASDLTFAQMQLINFDFFGTTVEGRANFNDSIFAGNVNFALDGLTRRLHLKNVDPLHKLYKQYQGDDDAEQDLTSHSYYGVRHVDDLTAKMLGDVSFANTIFEKFVNFEGVRFGSAGKGAQLANFYNTQLYGEAHFERTTFHARADFRTIFGNEVSFNGANFYSDFLLDDANVPGRLTLSGTDLHGDAKISFYGARIAAFGATFRQLIDAEGAHRLYYESCALDPEYSEAELSDPRLLDATWDPVKEVELTDLAIRSQRARSLCMERTVTEFVALKDSFSKRGMSQETDWAYWHLRHYKNRKGLLEAEGSLETAGWWFEWLLFEKGFGWGVRLTNLLGTGFVIVLLFVFLMRIFCGNMLVDWDNETIPYKDLPAYAMFIVSFHSFLGRARDWKSKSSPAAWKLLYTIEIIFGIILITFFIGAYTRMVLR